jgi:hypothetical protein
MHDNFLIHVLRKLEFCLKKVFTEQIFSGSENFFVIEASNCASEFLFFGKQYRNKFSHHIS